MQSYNFFQISTDIFSGNFYHRCAVRKLASIDQLNQIRRILCNRREEALGNAHLFEIEKDNSKIVNDLSDVLL